MFEGKERGTKEGRGRAVKRPPRRTRSTSGKIEPQKGLMGEREKAQARRHIAERRRRKVGGKEESSMIGWER